jgi:hypothetical protein
MSVSDLSEAAKAYGLRENQRQRIIESIYGSVLGLATAALLPAAAYLSVVVSLYQFLDE